MTQTVAAPPIRVLIAEDDLPARALLVESLVALGHSVVGEAGSCHEAVEHAQRLTPDVVLLDIHLPDANGFEVADRLTSEQPSPAVVMTSTHDGSDFEAMARRSGASGFVPKDELSGTAIGSLLA